MILYSLLDYQISASSSLKILFLVIIIVMQKMINSDLQVTFFDIFGTMSANLVTNILSAHGILF